MNLYTIGRVLLCLLLLISGLLNLQQASAAFTTEVIASNLSKPVAITHAGDGTKRLFITQQTGQVIIYDGQDVINTPFLDINNLVTCCGEQGLLSIAFHPKYQENKYLFVNYTNSLGNTVVARYSAASNPNTVALNSRRAIIGIAQPFANHQGGQLQFGRDGYLYIGMGDGGSGGDPGNRAQNLKLLLGKMLRLDVDNGLPYKIPSSNPFINNPNARPEIWAYGFRNPWRFSVDRQTGHFFIADVGQANWEEVNLQSVLSKGGENYGWRRMEGKHCFNPASNCAQGLILKRPFIEYSHDNGNCSVTGGYRYRGSAIPRLKGAYIYGDYCSGRIWRADFINKQWVVTLIIDTDFLISAFGEDEAGEIYFADYNNGTVYKIVNI